MAAGPAVDPLVQLGAALHHGRLSRGLSLRVLARRLGLSGHSVLVDYERGRLPPDYVIAGYERVFEDQDGALRGLRDAVFRARFERSDDRWGRGLALRGMGVAALAGADVPRARLYLEISAELFRQHLDERQLAETMRVLADLDDRDRR